MNDTDHAREWIEVPVRVAEYWPHSPWPDHSIAAYGRMLAHLPTDAILAAVEEYARTGRQHPPTGGMLLQKVLQQQLDAPDWGEAWGSIHWAIGTSIERRRELKARPCDACGGSRWIEVDEMTAGPCAACALNIPELEDLVRAQVHPVVWALIEEVGFEVIRDAGRTNTTFEAQCREKYKDLCSATVRDESLRGIEARNVRRLERVNRSGPLEIGRVLAELPESVEQQP